MINWEGSTAVSRDLTGLPVADLLSGKSFLVS